MVSLKSGPWGSQEDREYKKTGIDLKMEGGSDEKQELIKPIISPTMSIELEKLEGKKATNLAATVNGGRGV